MEWLKAWLKNPPAMIDSDPIAEGLYKQYHKIKMPNMHLTNAEIDALINYLQAKTEERRAMASTGTN